VLIGGAPLRVLRLTPGGAALVDAWSGGQPVGSSPAAQALARRLLDGGLAHPDPDRCAHPSPADTTVVIPVRDRPGGLEATLNALGPAGTGVIVVDDGSDPPVAGPATARVIRRARPGGPAAARNDGWRAAGTEIVVFLDADCQPQPGWLRTLLPHFADPAVAAVAPRITSWARPGTPPALAGYESGHSPLDLGDRPAPVRPGSRVPYVPTACLAVRRVALEGAGGFDESLHFGEDVDLVWRLGKGGWRVGYEPAATVRHPVRDSPGSWLRQRYQYGRSAAALAARHHRDVAPVAVSPWSAAAWGLAATGHPLAGAAIAAGSAAALARRAGRDQATARVLGGLAAGGTLRAGAALAEGIRRAWLPPALGAMAVLPPGRTRRFAASAVAAAFVLPAVTDWVRNRPPVGLPAWVGLRWADDLAYQSGVWAGALDARSGSALLPRW
jgi:mycofactocin system glycosyltransferase